jgi:ribosomal-protein-alanine N-acetyltransferase
MNRADVRRVRDIERRAYGPLRPRTNFERDAQSVSGRYLVAVEPGAPRATHGWLRRWAGRLGLVRDEPRERILGFAGGWLLTDQLHVTTVAVHPDARRRGVATTLLLALVDAARDAGSATLALEVRASNEGAQRLYERLGLRRAGTLPGYYRDNGEDAVVMLSSDLDDPAWTVSLDRLRGELPGRAALDLRAAIG